MGGNQCYETNTIRVGDTVVWTDYYDRTYQVTSVDVYDHLDGNFDSGHVQPGDTFSHTFDEIGDFLYFCDIPHSGHGLITVVNDSQSSETEPVPTPTLVSQNLVGKSSDGTLLVNLVSSDPKKGETIPIQISFSGKYDEPIADLDFVIIAVQEGSVIPISNDDITPDKKIDYQVGPLVSNGPLIIQIKPLELGHPNELNYLRINPSDTIILQTAANSAPAENPLIHDARISKVPDWFRTVFSWFDNHLITEDEIENAIKYLSYINIIHLN